MARATKRPTEKIPYEAELDTSSRVADDDLDPTEMDISMADVAISGASPEAPEMASKPPSGISTRPSPGAKPSPKTKASGRREKVQQAREHVGLLLEGRYELIRYIASGGFGSVLEGIDQATGERVAVKLFNAPESTEGRFWREVAMMRDLAHPVMVKLHAFGLVPKNARVGANQPYFVMEHVEGPTLREYVKSRSPMAPEDMLALLRPIADALDALHMIGIVHRDVKLDNILVTGDGEERSVRLIDLGIAFALAAKQTRITGENHVVASPYYVAPEAIHGGAPSGAMDCYSLAVCAYELMAGVRPFTGTAVDVMLSKTRELPPFMSEVGSRRFTVQLERAMRLCLDANPKSRPQRASAVLDLLESALREK